MSSCPVAAPFSQEAGRDVECYSVAPAGVEHGLSQDAPIETLEQVWWGSMATVGTLPHVH